MSERGNADRKEAIVVIASQNDPLIQEVIRSLPAMGGNRLARSKSWNYWIFIRQF